mgnify:CR=1 FL=1
MKTRWMTLTLVLVMAVAVMAAGPGITKANFDLIKKDMTYAEVVNILGKDGELMSESEFGEIKTQMYSWKAGRKDRGSLGANMNAMFQNERLVSKAQYGLK